MSLRCQQAGVGVFARGGEQQMRLRAGHADVKQARHFLLFFFFVRQAIDAADYHPRKFAPLTAVNRGKQQKIWIGTVIFAFFGRDWVRERNARPAQRLEQRSTLPFGVIQHCHIAPRRTFCAPLLNAGNDLRDFCIAVCRIDEFWLNSRASAAAFARGCLQLM